MSRNILTRLVTRPNCMLLLLLAAVGCVSLAAGRLVPDARLSLLLPVTLAAALLAYGLASWGTSKVWAGVLFLGIGPLVVFMRVAAILGPLARLAGETLFFVLQLVRLLYEQRPVDASAWLAADQALREPILGLGQRLVFWIGAVGRGIPIEDPAVIAWLWCIGLWLMAAWAGWQIKRYGRAVLGLLPATLLLGLILDYTVQSTGLLWLHLAAVLALLGLTNYERLNQAWMWQRMDFSDSTWEDTLLATILLTAALVSAGFIVSSISVKDILDKMRERPAASGQAAAQPGAPRAVQPAASPAGGLQRADLGSSHSILAGPKLSKTVVMVVSTGDFPSMPTEVDLQVPRYYWRTLTYQSYAGSSWFNPDRADVTVPSGQPLTSSLPANYSVIHQDVSFPQGAGGSLYWTGALVAADTTLEVAWRPQPQVDPAAIGQDPLLGADLVGASASAQSYSATSLLPQVSAADLRAAPPVYPAWVRARYLQLPDSTPERVRALARDLTAGSLTSYDRALAIQAYLRQIPYSLDVPAPPIGRDAADYFLFDLKKGYCDYYATAMTVLARAAGLPARFVVGYASGTYDPLSARYLVTAADAHAWTEIYFSGIGWIEFEPTAGQPALMRSDQAATLPSMQGAPSVPARLNAPAVLVRLLDLTWRPLAILLVLVLLWLWTDGLRLSFSDPAVVLQQLYRRLRRLARPLRGAAPPGETAREYAAVLCAQVSARRAQGRVFQLLPAPAEADIRLIAGLYGQSLFAPRRPSRAEARRALKSWSGLRWRLLLMNLIGTLQHKPA